MITGAIFDVDGTLLDSMQVWKDAGERYLKSLGITAEPNLDRILYTMSMVQGAEYLKQRYLMSVDVDQIITGINNTIQEFYDHEVLLKFGVKQFLKEMKQCGIRMTVATSSDRCLIEKSLKRLEILDFFDCIFTCSEVGAGKSKPDIYLAAMRYMNTERSGTWVFEDAFYAMQTAKQAGFRVVGVYDAASIDTVNEIKEISDLYLEELADFDAFAEFASHI